MQSSLIYHTIVQLVRERKRNEKGGPENEEDRHLLSNSLVVMVRSLPPITNEVQPANDLANCEESNDFRGSDSSDS